MSPIVVSFGATPFITNKDIPKGGVIIASSMLSRTIVANQTSLNPKVRIKGTNIGRVIIIMPTGSIKPPIISIRICMVMIKNILGNLRLIPNSTRPWLAPLKERISLKANAAAMIKYTIPVILSVPYREVLITPQLSWP